MVEGTCPPQPSSRRVKPKGAPACPGMPWGLAFETWDPGNRFKIEAHWRPSSALDLTEKEAGLHCHLALARKELV